MNEVDKAALIALRAILKRSTCDAVDRDGRNWADIGVELVDSMLAKHEGQGATA